MADSNSIYCPGCRKHTAIEKRAREAPEHGADVMYEIGECNNCEQRFLVIRTLPQGHILGISPNALPKPVDSSIPPKIKSDLEEAYQCESVGALRAAATMARRAMQNICLDKGAPKKRTITDKQGNSREVKNDLVRQIDWLFDQRIITADLKDWAHEIRLVGNAGAHPGDAEDEEPITKQGAQDILELVDAFCHPLYIASEIYKKRHPKTEQAT